MKLVRYVKQRDKYSCSAVAVLNLYKYFGEKLTLQDLPTIKARLNTKVGKGTHKDSTSKFLKETFRTSSKEQLDLRTLDSFLKTNNPVYISFDYKDADGFHGHAALIIKRTPKYYYGINLLRGETITKISRKRLSSLLREKSSPEYCGKSFGMLISGIKQKLRA